VVFRCPPTGVDLFWSVPWSVMVWHQMTHRGWRQSIGPNAASARKKHSPPDTTASYPTTYSPNSTGTLPAPNVVRPIQRRNAALREHDVKHRRTGAARNTLSRIVFRMIVDNQAYPSKVQSLNGGDRLGEGTCARSFKLSQSSALYLWCDRYIDRLSIVSINLSRTTLETGARPTFLPSGSPRPPVNCPWPRESGCAQCWSAPPTRPHTRAAVSRGMVEEARGRTGSPS
jgi:hypothetical protein